MIQDQDERVNVRPASDRLTAYGISQARDFAKQTKGIVRECISVRLLNNSIDWNAEDMSDEAQKIDKLAAWIMEELAFAGALSRPIMITYGDIFEGIA